ncbi:hypothetical protein VIGAN_05141100 [Vigna angularis var. angularis]|uniref:Uncharacterized protein n=1 Tax=Vigna angularis var. angularis TaxID=157739 RepID=A0A0S3S579_PHAAN|nr:hypothetical protein VIGAN_05141100 [Vigna angularis var. angularis]
MLRERRCATRASLRGVPKSSAAAMILAGRVGSAAMGDNRIEGFFGGVHSLHLHTLSAETQIIFPTLISYVIRKKGLPLYLVCCV